MEAVEETRKAIQDFLAPEIRSITAQMQALVREQCQLRSELSAMDSRLRSDVSAVKSDLSADISAVKADLSAGISGLEGKLRSDLSMSEGRTRAEITASEARVTAAIERLRSDMPLLIRNAVLEQLLAEKQRGIEDLQKQTH